MKKQKEIMEKLLNHFYLKLNLGIISESEEKRALKLWDAIYKPKKYSL